MSAEDGLVMQMHAGTFRNHNPFLFERFGADKGHDIPVATEFTHNLKPVSYTHLRAHETVLDLVCRLLLEKQTNTNCNV